MNHPGHHDAQPVSSLNLNPSLRAKLAKAGYRSVRDLKEASPVELSKDLGISNEEAAVIFQQLQKGTIQTFSAAESLERERQRRGISTSSASIDDLLGGSGIPVCKITEFCGEPGIGKTQLGIQLSINVQIPVTLSGAAGEAIYIDTEGSFIVQRVAQMAGVMLDKVNGQLGDQVDNMLTLDMVLSGIHYFRVHDFVELLALIKTLDEFIRSHPKVKLIVVDSIAFHFRLNFPDMALRTRLLNGVAQTLMQLASEFELAVVLMNQMTTKMEQSKLVPALGESWGHASTNRIILYQRNKLRYARLYKSPNLQEGTVPYQISTAGITDITELDRLNSRKRPLETEDDDE